ncbi:MAG: glycosyltransferase 87 family protein [Dehalococcoidia bacterium]
MDTASLNAGEVEFSIRIKPIAYVLVAGLLLRLFLAALPGFGIDMGSFQAWSLQLADRGPWSFYDQGFFADYAPGYLYILLLFGGLNTVFQFSDDRFQYLLKLPPIAADLASAYLLYRLLEGQRPSVRLGAAALYLLLPAILLIGPVWGQVDSLLAFFLLLTVYYFAKGRPVLASLAYVVGFLVKPQAVAALPLFVFWLLRDYRPRAWLHAASSSLAAGVFIVLPFFPQNPFNLVAELRNSANVYQFNSFWAYNFWGLFGTLKGGVLAMFKPDDATFLGASHFFWGIFLFLLASFAIIFVLREHRDPGHMALGMALSVLAFFLFLTRMHERYLFPFFLPLLAAGVLLKSRLLGAVFVVLSVIHFFNLYHVYFYYNRYFDNPDLRPEPLFLMIDDRVFLFSLLTTLAFPALLLAGHLLAKREGGEAEP